MSVIPSIFVRSLRTEAAQLPHVIFGTLSDTRTPSLDFVSAGAVAATGGTAGSCETCAETGSVSAAHPAMDAMTPAVSSIGTNFFTVILQKKPNNTKSGCERSSFKGLLEKSSNCPTRHANDAFRVACVSGRICTPHFRQELACWTEKGPDVAQGEKNYLPADSFPTSSGVNARSKTEISSRRPSQFSALSLRPPK